MGWGVGAGFVVGAAWAAGRFDEWPPWAGRFACDRAAGAGVLWGSADDIEVSVWRRDPWGEVFFDNGASDGRDFFDVRAPVECDFSGKPASDDKVFPDGLASAASDFSDKLPANDRVLFVKRVSDAGAFFGAPASAPTVPCAAFFSFFFAAIPCTAPA